MDDKMCLICTVNGDEFEHAIGTGWYTYWGQDGADRRDALLDAVATGCLLSSRPRRRRQ